MRSPRRPGAHIPAPADRQSAPLDQGLQHIHASRVSPQCQREAQRRGGDERGPLVARGPRDRHRLLGDRQGLVAPSSHHLRADSIREREGRCAGCGRAIRRPASRRTSNASCAEAAHMRQVPRAWSISAAATSSVTSHTCAGQHLQRPRDAGGRERQARSGEEPSSLLRGCRAERRCSLEGAGRRCVTGARRGAHGGLLEGGGGGLVWAERGPRPGARRAARRRARDPGRRRGRGARRGAPPGRRARAPPASGADGGRRPARSRAPGSLPYGPGQDRLGLHHQRRGPRAVVRGRRSADDDQEHRLRASRSSDSRRRR